MTIRELTPSDNLIIADIIRDNLEKHALDIPGTVYFDANLNRLTEYYGAEPSKRKYFILENEEHKVIGGVGLAEFEGFDSCAELQKLYLIDEYKGQGLGRYMVEYIMQTAASMGYTRMYLETHTNLMAAIHLYEKCGFELIDKPDCVVHNTMNRFYLRSL